MHLIRYLEGVLGHEQGGSQARRWRQSDHYFLMPYEALLGQGRYGMAFQVVLYIRSQAFYCIIRSYVKLSTYTSSAKAYRFSLDEEDLGQTGLAQTF